MTDDDANDREALRLRDLTMFDHALHKMFDDGLLSERTMVKVYALAHGESQQMVEMRLNES